MTHREMQFDDATKKCTLKLYGAFDRKELEACLELIEMMEKTYEQYNNKKAERNRRGN